MRATGRQGGWAGLATLLLVLAIVAFASRDALRGYFASATAPAEAARAEGRTRLPTAAPDPTQASPAAAAPIERARGVEATVGQAAEERHRRLDGTAR